MKLQINSLQALERLIGGDTEVEIEVRNNIVQAFAKKHLKEIANSTMFATVGADVKSATEAMAREQTTQALNKLGMFNGQRWNQTFVLQPEIKTELRTQALQAVRDAINEAVKSAVAKYDESDAIKRLIDGAIDTHVKSMINEQVKQKLAEITAKMLS